MARIQSCKETLPVRLVRFAVGLSSCTIFVLAFCFAMVGDVVEIGEDGEGPGTRVNTFAVYDGASATAATVAATAETTAEAAADPLDGSAVDGSSSSSRAIDSKLIGWSSGVAICTAPTWGEWEDAGVRGTEGRAEGEEGRKDGRSGVATDGERAGDTGTKAIGDEVGDGEGGEGEGGLRGGGLLFKGGTPAEKSFLSSSP